MKNGGKNDMKSAIKILDSKKEYRAELVKLLPEEKVAAVMAMTTNV